MTEIIDANQLALPELATKINTTVRAAEDKARSALSLALEAGRLLNDAKSRVEHGAWDAWLAENCEMAPRTARSYMRLARAYPELPEPERQRVADLPVREAVKAIATDPTAPARTAAAYPPKDRGERDRVVHQFQNTAKDIREAAKWFAHGLEVKPQKVLSLRKKLADMLVELDRLEVKP